MSGGNKKKSNRLEVLGLILMFVFAANWGRTDWISSTSFFGGFFCGVGAVLAIYGKKISEKEN